MQEATVPIQHINIIRHLIPDDGKFPNNGLLPLIVYEGALLLSNGKILEEIYESNRWVNSWQGGIFDFHHYHSTAHEVLGVIQGNARVQFGGESGISLSVKKGDVIIVPAGVAHKCIDCDEDFKVVGAYPEGQLRNILYGKEEERPIADENIKSLELPESDPVFGTDGPLLKNWAL